MNPDAQLPLRAIHAASPGHWWPPAPGWWALALLAVVLAVWVMRQLWIRYRAWRHQQALKAEYAGIMSRYESNRDGRLLLADSATFFRRLLIHIGRHRSWAGVVGEAWARHLGAVFPGDEKMQQVCSDLACCAYQIEVTEVDPARLRELAARWIECCVAERQARV